MSLELKFLKNIQIRLNRAEVYRHLSSSARAHAADTTGTIKQKPEPRTEVSPPDTTEIKTKFIATQKNEKSDYEKKSNSAVVDPFHCQSCSRSFATVQALKCHSKVHSPNRPNYKCQFCGRVLPAKSKLESHIRGQHTNKQLIPEKSQTCPQGRKSVDDVGAPVHTQTCPQGRKSVDDVGAPVHTQTCPQCGKVCGNQKRLESHIRKRHEKIRAPVIHTCVECGKICPNKAHLKTHLRKHHGIFKISKTKAKQQKCPECGKTCSSQKRLESHIRNRHERSQSQVTTPIPANVSWTCAQCGKICPSQELLDRHVQSKHTNRTCPLCDKVFAFAYMLEKHIVVHTKERPFQCQLCKNSFSRQSGLDSHSKLHTEQDFRCEQCSLQFTMKSRLEDHIRKEHSVPSESGTVQSVAILSKSKIVPKIQLKPNISGRCICPKCSKIFPSPSRLRQHIVSHTNVRAFKCSKCPATFKYSYNLSHHRRTNKSCGIQSHKVKLPKPSAEINRIANERHLLPKNNIKMKLKISGPVKCPHCPKIFRQKCQLRGHMVVHTGEKPYQCDKCNNTYAFPAGLHYHLKTHTSQDYRCEKCHLSFTQESLLDKHVKNDHLQGRGPLNIPKLSPSKKTGNMSTKILKRSKCCPQCFKVFLKPYQLRDHMVVHTGKKPHICSKCNIAFAFRSALYRHSKTHTDNDVRCGKCHLSFPDKSGLDKHVKDSHNSPANVHRTKINASHKYTCPECFKVFRTPSKLKHHMVVHTGEKPYQCQKCHRAFAFRQTLVNHSRAHTENDVQCHQCHLSFPDQQRYEDHRGNCYSMQTPSTNNANTQAHSSSRSRNDSKLQMSLKLKFKSRRRRLKQEDIACQHCFKAFENPSKLQRHMVVHTGEKPFECQTCKMRFSFRSALQTHSNKMHTVHCEKCELSFPDKRRLEKHVKMSHFSSKPPTSPLSPSMIIGNSKIKKLKRQRTLATCPHCFKVFQKGYLMGKHMVVHTQEKPYQCQKCMKSFAFKQTLTRHSLKHTDKDFHCEKCTLRFIMKIHLDSHINTVHGQRSQSLTQQTSFQGVLSLQKKRGIPTKIHAKRQNSCQQCYKRFPTSTKLKLHMISHSNERSFKCFSCDKTFKYPYQLSRHHRENGSCRNGTAAVFNQLRCGHCDLSFSSMPELEVHMKVHDTSPSRTLTLTVYRCDLCEEVFSSNAQLMQHSAIHDETTANQDVPSFQCQYCSKTFLQENRLQTHMILHTRENRFQCTICHAEFMWATQLQRHCKKNHPGQVVRAINQRKLVKISPPKSPVSVSALNAAPRRQVSTPNSSPRKLVPAPEQYLCKICGWDFVSKARLQRHSITHKDDKHFPCLLCGLAFTTKHLLTRHGADIHGEVEMDNFDCQLCDLSFPTRYLLKHHILLHKNDTPNRPGPSAAAPNVKDRVKKYKRKERNVCSYCTKVFRTARNLRTHMAVHTNEKQFKCQTCDKAFATSYRLERHSKGVCANSRVSPPAASISVPEVPREILNCKHCGKHFFRQEALETHLRSHEQEETLQVFECKKCDQKVPFSEISDHMQMHGTDEVSPSPGTVRDSNPNFKCHLCGKTLRDLRNLRNHIKLHTGEKPHKCNIGDCDRAFVTFSELKMHRRAKLHNPTGIIQETVPIVKISSGNSRKDVPDFECKLCGKMLCSVKTLRNHLKLHSAERPYECGIEDCVRAYATRGVLRKHQRVHHSAHNNVKKMRITQNLASRRNLMNANVVNRPNPNTYAPVKFRKFRLTTGDVGKDKPHVCDMCSRAFARPDGLRLHMKYHLGIRDFKCPICDKGFFQKAELVAHQAVHTGIKPFVCHLCYLGFGYKQSLKHHLKSHEGNVE